MSTTSSFCVLLQHVGEQIKDEIPAHRDKVVDMFLSDCVEFRAFFKGEAKLF